MLSGGRGTSTLFERPPKRKSRTDASPARFHTRVGHALSSMEAARDVPAPCPCTTVQRARSTLPLAEKNVVARAGAKTKPN